MGKHKDRAKKQKARSSGRKHKYGTDSYDTGSSEFSGDDAMDYQAFGGAGKDDEDGLARQYINERSSTCGRMTSALFCTLTLAMSGLAIAYANMNGADGVDCGERNPLNVSYFNWLIILGVSLFAVFLMQLLVSLLSCCTKPEWDSPLPTDWEGPMRSTRELKMGARRIACASFLIMVMGTVLFTWLVYGLWVFVPGMDVFQNGTHVPPTRENRELFASPDCFALHKFGFILEIVLFAYVGVYLVSRCCFGVGFCNALTLLKPVLL